MASGPVSCEAKHVFSVANKQMYSVCTYIICHHTNTGDGVNTSTNSTNDLILLPFLDGQAECLQTRVCIYYKSFLLLGLGTCSALELFHPFVPHCLLHTCTRSAASPEHHRFSSSSPWTPLCSSSSRVLQLPLFSHCVPSQFQGHSAGLLASPAWYSMWLHPDLQKLMPCFAGTTDPLAPVTRGLSPCPVDTDGHQREARESCKRRLTV